MQWDTAGQEKFRKITFGLYRGAHGIILAYDITKKATLDNLDKWLKDITDYGGEKVTKIVAGNKTVCTTIFNYLCANSAVQDMETERVVTTEQGQVRLPFTVIPTHVSKLITICRTLLTRTSSVSLKQAQNQTKTSMKCSS